MTKDQLTRLGSMRDTFNLADRSLDRALLHVPQMVTRMRAAARFGYTSTARVEETLAAVATVSAKLQQARADFDAAKRVVVGFGDVELWRQLEKSYGDVEPIPCPEKKGSLEQLEVAFGDADQCPPNEWGLELDRPQEVAFGDHEIPGFWDCPWEGKASPNSVTVGFGDGDACPPKKGSLNQEVAYGDVEPIPSPEKKKGSLGANSAPLPAEVVAAARGIKREINLAEGMIDRAFRCTTNAIASAVEERRELRVRPTFGQEVLDHLIAAQAMLSNAFAELYAVHETLVDVQEEVEFTVAAGQIQAA